MDKRIIVEKDNKKAYYVNSDIGYRNIDEEISQGQILVDDNKTWNKNPLMLKDSDYIFIKEHLQNWFNTQKISLSTNSIADLEKISLQQLQSKIKYVFTNYFHDPIDVFLLKLQYDSTVYRIYICKTAFHLNTDTWTLETKLLYPFENEEWNSNFYESKEEYLKMREKEEDGYNKYFKNPE